MKRIFARAVMAALIVSSLGAVSFADGLKTVSVDRLQTVGQNEEQKGAMITIKEKEKDAWPENVTFELKLPSGVKWNSRTFLSGNINPQIDGNVLKFTLQTSKGYEEKVNIVPYFDIDRSTSTGELTVRVSTNAKDDKDETVSIANVSDFAVNISSSYERASKNAKSIPVELILSESVQNSLLPNQIYSLEFDNATINANSVKVEQKSGLDKLVLGDIKENYFEFKLEESATNINKYFITLDIEPAKDYTGNITAKFEGKGVEKIETVVAKLSQVLEVTQREIDDVKLAFQGQELEDVVLKEMEASALATGNYTLKITPEYKGLEIESVTLTADGDIRVSSASAKNNEIKFRVTGESTSASSLKFSDLKVALDAFGYDGEYKLQLTNDKYPDTVLEEITLFKVNEKTEQKVSKEKDDVIAFVIDSKDYTVTEEGKTETKTLDVAPYIAGGRTMLPVRAVAEVLDIDVDWDAQTKTATLTSKDKEKTIILTLGNKVMLVDGEEVELDSAPEVKESRTFLPLRQIAQALDIDVNWDAQTRTVTIEK